MHSSAILHEAQQLHNVSDRLDVLEVLVATRMGPLAGPDPANA
jgi:hypothetical protein